MKAKKERQQASAPPLDVIEGDLPFDTEAPKPTAAKPKDLIRFGGPREPITQPYFARLRRDYFVEFTTAKSAKLIYNFGPERNRGGGK